MRILKKIIRRGIRPGTWSFIIFGPLLLAWTLVPAFSATPDDLFLYWAQRYSNSVRKEVPTLDVEFLAKAKPDECFYGLGDPRNIYPVQGCADGTPKTNDSYIWGLTKSGHKVWFGVASNVNCLTTGLVFGGSAPDPQLNDSWVCEYGESRISPPAPANFGDWRPPSIYVYNMDSMKLRKAAYLIPGSMGGIPAVAGIRSAGSLEGIVFLTGPSFDFSDISEGFASGLTLFAYNSETEEFLGWHKLKDQEGNKYNDCRKWLVANGELYAAVWQGKDGHILRWLGDPAAIKNGELSSLWNFEEVGDTMGHPSELCVYDENRLAVATRGAGTSFEDWTEGGLWISPSFVDHLRPSDAGLWQEVWTTSDYEPDPVTAKTYGTGALSFWQGYLWWGTMHIPGTSYFVHRLMYSDLIDNYPDSIQDQAARLGTYRLTTLFRGRKLGTPDQEIDLVYGMSNLPTFVYDPASKTGEWQILPNNMGGKTPLWGASGFDNWYNHYTWAMRVYNDQLFVGTLDISYVFTKSASSFSLPNFPIDFGADLWRFRDPNSPAVPESLDGIGNYTSYGIRTMISDDALYLGMANPMNLMTDPYDDLPEGGWELLRLTGDPPQPGDLNADGVIDEQDVELFFSAFGSRKGADNYLSRADFDKNGQVDFGDYSQFMQIYYSSLLGWG